MFPTPIQNRSRANQISYQALLPIALILWLLPLLAVMVFSIKPDGDFAKGNYWGLPSSFEFFNNYTNHIIIGNTARYWTKFIVISYLVKFNFCIRNKSINFFYFFLYGFIFISSTNIFFSR